MIDDDYSKELEVVLKGLEAERKFVEMVSRLINEYFPWILRVQHATPKQDICSVDFSVVLFRGST